MQNVFLALTFGLFLSLQVVLDRRLLKPHAERQVNSLVTTTCVHVSSNFAVRKRLTMFGSVSRAQFCVFRCDFHNHDFLTALFLYLYGWEQPLNLAPFRAVILPKPKVAQDDLKKHLNPQIPCTSGWPL